MTRQTITVELDCANAEAHLSRFPTEGQDRGLAPDQIELRDQLRAALATPTQPKHQYEVELEADWSSGWPGAWIKTYEAESPEQAEELARKESGAPSSATCKVKRLCPKDSDWCDGELCKERGVECPNASSGQPVPGEALVCSKCGARNCRHGMEKVTPARFAEIHGQPEQPAVPEHGDWPAEVWVCRYRGGDTFWTEKRQLSPSESVETRRFVPAPDREGEG